MRYLLALLFLLLIATMPSVHAADVPMDSSRDILVTFDNTAAASLSGGGAAAYRYRKRYSISPQAQRDAKAVAAEYSFVEVDHWPIKSLSVYCFVYRIAEDADRETVLHRLELDERIESAQALHEFGTESGILDEYDDTYANLQHSLTLLDITAAHRHATGRGVRVAIIDSYADGDHEDLRGRVRKIEVFSERQKTLNREHGTAVASVIGANANNALGIVGIAPDASMDVFVSCWEESGNRHAVCTSFTLAKALDALLEDPPQILNLSLAGPDDPLIRRLLAKAIAAGVVLVAARATDSDGSNHFPASADGVIGVGSSKLATGMASATELADALYAPGQQILVAVPENGYEFRSGSSLAAAHVSGVVALLLSVSPELPSARVQELLYESQQAENADMLSVNACLVLHIDDSSRRCE